MTLSDEAKNSVHGGLAMREGDCRKTSAKLASNEISPLGGRTLPSVVPRVRAPLTPVTAAVSSIFNVNENLRSAITENLAPTTGTGSPGGLKICHKRVRQ